MSDELSYTLEAASQRLGGMFTVAFLKGHLREIPHLKGGTGRGRAGRIGFTEAHLQAILAMFSVEPAPQPDPKALTPLRRRRAS